MTLSKIRDLGSSAPDKIKNRQLKYKICTDQTTKKITLNQQRKWES